MKLSDAFMSAGIALVVVAALLLNVILGVFVAGLACVAVSVLLVRSGGVDGDS